MIHCNCGHRILHRDVIQTGLYLSILGPNYVYVRFRCRRCKRVREQLVQESNWDPSVLRESRGEMKEEDLQRFREMGEITPEEVIDFHYALAGLGAEPESEG